MLSSGPAWFFGLLSLRSQYLQHAIAITKKINRATGTKIVTCKDVRSPANKVLVLVVDSWHEVCMKQMPSMIVAVKVMMALLVLLIFRQNHRFPRVTIRNSLTVRK